MRIAPSHRGNAAGSGQHDSPPSDVAPGTRVLVVDDDPMIAESLAEFLEGEGFVAAVASCGAEAIELLATAEKAIRATENPKPFAVVISDVSMPDIGGMELLRHVTTTHPATVVILLTGYGSIEAAVDALRHGAVDYLTKPVLDSELRLCLQRALRQHALAAENVRLHQQLDTRYGLGSIIGSDVGMQKTYTLIEAVSPTRTTVLMNGESGTGKSLMARAIHQRSTRRDKPFVELACGSIPETLLESELFGHIKGSFTGAHADKTGKFLAANGGTLFLDEINSAPPSMQLKLLRVLQEKRFEPVGSNTTIEVDVRVILATNQPLEDLVASGAFRQDLYYRINVVKIDLPSLRERTSDIPALATHFLTLHAKAMGKPVRTLGPGVLDALRRYTYPGNVRELGNIIERAVVLCRSEQIMLDDLAPNVVGAAAHTENAVLPVAAQANPSGPSLAPTVAAIVADSLHDAMRDPERKIILAAIASCNGNKLKAAELLKINRTTLYKKMHSLGIDPRTL